MSEAEQSTDWRRWLRFAGEDLQVAEAGLTQLGFPPWVCCFHAQQAAEKAIKAALVALGIAFPRRHDLDGLRNLLPEGWQIKREMPDLEPLSSWAVEARYPGDLPDSTMEDAREAIEQARKVVDLVVADLRANGFSSPV